MKFFIKGGVWKNSEDEILKASVMKYGKSDWGRVASLMPRKTAKQCKARWYEWLDPSIKKTEWTREEEEKLLHMAKLMPTQWRTIAPIVGRTAAQCLARYEKLLDEAQRREGGEGGDAIAGDDPRRLRPGEIDPNPESKPAKPDPTDMDEDELEMLSEARARLANTRGKKAKRRAREKQLIEAKRLATLQKRRELRAAGILGSDKGVKRRMRQRQREIDYANEIPFHKVTPAGFYDVSEENGRLSKERTAESERKFIARRANQIANQSEKHALERKRKREMDRDARLRKRDNLPAHIRAVSRETDAPASFKRTKLSLPKPQVTHADLEAIVKAGVKSGEIEDHLGRGSGPTSALVFDQYANAVTESLSRAQQLRTPRTPTAADPIHVEARNAIARTQTTTPLLGGDNVEMVEGGTGFRGAEPETPSLRTPSVLSSGRGGSVDSRATPQSTIFASLPTPSSVRDGLSIHNDGRRRADRVSGRTRDDDDDVRSTSGRSVSSVSTTRSVAMNAREHRRQLRVGFGSLPEPQYDYAVELPDPIPDENDEDTTNGRPAVPDAGEQEILRRKIEAAKRAEELRKRSEVLKRHLPRPSAPSRAMLNTECEGEDITHDEDVDGLVARVALKLVKYDSVKFPVPSSKKKKKKKKKHRVPLLENVTETELTNARALIAAEVGAREKITPLNEDAFDAAWDEAISSRTYVPSSSTFRWTTDLDDAELLSAARHEFEVLQERLQTESARASKMERKIGVKHGGYRSVRKKLAGRAAQACDRVAELRHQIAAFRKLMFREERALPERLERLRELLRRATEREQGLQRKYRELERTHRGLWDRVRGSGGENGSIAAS
eukprot:g2303.t1